MIPIGTLSTQWTGKIFTLACGLVLIVVFEWRALSIQCAKVVTFTLGTFGETDITFGTLATFMTSLFTTTNTCIMITPRIGKA